MKLQTIKQTYKEYTCTIGDAIINFSHNNATLISSSSERSLLHSHNTYELFFVAEGKVEVVMEENTTILNGGDLAIIPKNTAHYTLCSDDSKRVVLLFAVAENKKASEKKYFRQYLSLLSEDIFVCRNFPYPDIFARFINYCSSNYREKKELIHACLYEMAILIKMASNIQDSVPVVSSAPTSNVFRNFIVDNFFDLEHFGTIQQLAAELHLSIQQTERIVKKMYNQTFREHMLFTRMKHAKHFLLTTDLSAVEIASELGYTQSHSFFTAFKKFYGMTPTEFRTKHNQ